MSILQQLRNAQRENRQLIVEINRFREEAHEARRWNRSLNDSLQYLREKIQSTNERVLNMMSGTFASDEEAAYIIDGVATYLRGKVVTHMSSYQRPLEDSSLYKSMSYETLCEAFSADANMTPVCRFFRELVGPVETSPLKRVHYFKNIYLAIASVLSCHNQSFVHPYAFLYGSYVWKKSKSAVLTNLIGDIFPGGMAYSLIRSITWRMCD
jgi:hypothetical protein